MQLPYPGAIDSTGEDDRHRARPMTFRRCDTFLHFIAIGSIYLLQIKHSVSCRRRREHRRLAASSLEGRQSLGEVLTQAASRCNIELGDDDYNVNL
jgi:hypothetical protein